MPTQTPQPAFVLIRPQMGENIGAAARGMWNFGLDRMRIIDPRDGWPNQKAVAMASGAGRLLDEAQIFDDTAAAIADCDYVYATTARPRGLTKLVLTPEAAMQDARARIAEGQKVAVMFGPERSGMENEDIARANAIISVPIPMNALINRPVNTFIPTGPAPAVTPYRQPTTFNSLVSTSTFCFRSSVSSLQNVYCVQ